MKHWKIRDMSNAVIDLAPALPAETSQELAVCVEGLRLKYPGEDRLLFKDLSFSAVPGEKVLLLGPSGCGKSTLLQVLSGMIPRATEVPMKCEVQRVPDSWGYVFQDPDTQFCMPYVDEELAFVLENLSVPREEMRERMLAALEEVGLELDELHTPIAHLSQGMKQRLALASALLLEPEVLFLDEPSALLDPEGREQIWSAVKDVSEGRTLIIVEHRIEEMAQYVDRVVLFSPDGEILGDGPPAAIFTDYEQELKSYGIWYPGVWEDYAQSPAGRELFAPIDGKIQIEENRLSGAAAALPEALHREPVIRLEAFKGIREPAGHLPSFG